LNSDHPPADVIFGQELVLHVFHAIAASPTWEKTLLVITYHEHGGFFDHVVPPEAPDPSSGFQTYGPRVPALVVSPWVEPGSASSTVFEHCAIIKTILLRFCRHRDGSIPDMGTPVTAANHLGSLLTRSVPRPAPSISSYQHLVDGVATHRAKAFARVIEEFDVSGAPQPSASQHRLLAARQRLSQPLPARPTVAAISKKMAPVQAGALSTVLPIIGLKPFDLANDVFPEFSGIVAAKDPAELGLRPVSLVLAVDGSRWKGRPTDLLDSLRCTLITQGARRNFKPRRLKGSMSDVGRVRHVLTEAPANAFEIEIQSPILGSLRVAATAMRRRATVVTLLLLPDGSFELSQNLLRLPGLVYEEPAPPIGYERMLRDLQLGQKLYDSGELASQRNPSSTLNGLFNGQWIDPILSCMAYYSSGGTTRQRTRPERMRVVADGLRRYFASVPDSRVIDGLAHPRSRDDVFRKLVASGELPVLARSARALTGSRAGRENPDSPVAVATRRDEPGQAWLASWSARAAPRMRSTARATRPC